MYFRTAFNTSQGLHMNQRETCWNPLVLHEKNVSVSKCLLVKTATNYGEFLKNLMRGGDLQIESCGCIVPQISQQVYCIHICTKFWSMIHQSSAVALKNISHCLKDVSIIVGIPINKMQSYSQGDTVICHEQENFLPCRPFTVEKHYAFMGNFCRHLRNLPFCD